MLHLYDCNKRYIGLDKVQSWLPWWLSGKKSTCQWRRSGFDPWIRKILWRRKWKPTPVFLPGKSCGQRNLAGNSPWGCKELDTTYWLNNNNKGNSNTATNSDWALTIAWALHNISFLYLHQEGLGLGNRQLGFAFWLCPGSLDELPDLSPSQWKNGTNNSTNHPGV